MSIIKMLRLNRGKQYYAGLLHGLAIGLMLGTFFILKYDLIDFDKKGIHLPIFFISIILIVVGHRVYDSTKGNKTS